MSSALIPASENQLAGFGRRPLIAPHLLAASDLFTDQALIELLDRHPRDKLFALTMGSDPEKPDENRLALHDGVSGEQLFRAVQNGRLWLNITCVDKAHRRYADLLNALYADLAKQVPGFRPTIGKGTMLLSSPSAQVYYHVDGAPSVLWHIRGKKRVWVYPPLDERFISRDHLEDIFAGAAHEYVPYRLEFDQRATVLDLAPGDFASWPQNAPHRVANMEGLNVSLSTEHFTTQSRRRARLYCANRFLRQSLRFRASTTFEHGTKALVKLAIHKAARLAGLDTTQTKKHVATMRVDPTAPLGCVELPSQPDAAG